MLRRLCLVQSLLCSNFDGLFSPVVCAQSFVLEGAGSNPAPVSLSQFRKLPSKKRHKPSRKKIRNTTYDQDL